MKRLNVLFLTLVFMLTLFTTSAFAGEMQQKLLDKLPQKGEQLTRAEFISMLVTAAELAAPTSSTVSLPQDVPTDAWYAADMKVALAAGVIKGSGQNTISPNDKITQAQAVAILSRVMNLPSSEAPGPVATPVAKTHWAYVPYTWLVKEGIVDYNTQAEQALTPDAAAALLDKVFGTTKQAKEIIEKNQAAQAKVTTQRTSGDMTLTVQTNPAAANQQIPANISMKAKVIQEINLEQGLRQQFNMTINGLPMDIPTIEMDQYMVAEGLYMKMSDPTTGEDSWIKMTDDTMPNIVELMQQQSKVMGVPQEMDKYFRYRVVGEKKLGDKTYQELSFYGNIDNLSEFMSMLGNQTGLTEELTKNLDQASQMIKGITMVGKMYVDPKTYYAERVNVSAVVNFADKFEGEAFPIKSVTINCDFDYKDFGSKIEVKLPKEAATALEMGAGAEQSVTATEEKAAK